MKNGLIGAFLVVVFAVAAAQAEDGAMSRSKLSKLGLSSLVNATDAQGMQVRGEGRMFISGAGISIASGSHSKFTYGAQAWTPNAIGFGISETQAEYSVISTNALFSFNAATFGRSFAFAP